MKLTIVGSGTAAPHADRVCSSYLLEAAETRLLLDCGPGAVHHLARFELPWQTITHVALSHFHNDHIGDLPFLLFALKHGVAKKRKERLVILGPVGTCDLLDKMAEVFGDHVSDPGFPLEIREVEPGATIPLGRDVRVRTMKTKHTDESLGYRVRGPDGVLGYTGDTGADPELASFFRDVDVLIAECSLPDASPMKTHLHPSDIAGMARVAQPGLLVLTHMFPQVEATDVLGSVGEAGWEGKTVTAADGETHEVKGS